MRNAIDATPSGGKISVRSSTQGDELSWWFGDSGKGIAPTKQPIFSILFTAAAKLEGV